MARPRVCLRCKRGDKGDGVLVRPFLWGHNSFLRETNQNIRKYGVIERVEVCQICINEIIRQGHKVKMAKEAR